MSNETAIMLQDLDSIRKFCYQTILDIIGDYIYREQRYATHFSVAIIYSKTPLNIHTQELEKTLRKTDNLICITDNIVCIVFDAVQTHSYVKASENLYRTLKSIEYHQHYFIATSFSDDFNKNYLDMINHLFDRLHYSVEHNCQNSVNYEDYII